MAGRLRNRWGGHVVVLGLYVALTLAMTYPLAFHLTTHVPGGNVDEGAFVWNIWWVSHALLQGQNPLTTDMIFYPVGANLALYTLTLLNGILAIPILLLAGPIVANNVTIIVGFALSGYGTYLLARYVLRTMPRGTPLEPAAVAAGIVFAFGSGRFAYAALGQVDYVSLQWLPLGVLAILRLWDCPTRHSALVAGVMMAFAAYNELNIAVLLLFFVVLMLLWRHRELTPQRLGMLISGVVVFTALFAPLGLAIVQETLRTGDYLIRGWGGAERFVVDVLGPLTPSVLHPLWGYLALDMRFTDINFGFIGYVGLIAAVVGAWRWRRSLWTWTALIFLLLSFGPLLHLNGRSDFDLDTLIVNIPLPYIVIHYIPFLRGARIPGRFAIMAVLAGALLIALALATVGRMRPALRRMTALGVTIAFLVENAAIPLPLSAMSVPSIYNQLAMDPGGGIVLQIPLGWRDGFGTLGAERTLMQSFQAVHGKPILGGNTSRSPEGLFAYFAQAPIIGSLALLEEGKTLPEGRREQDRALAMDMAAFYGIRYVVVHAPWVGSPAHAYVQDMLPLEEIGRGVEEVSTAVWRFDLGMPRVERRHEDRSWIAYRVTLSAEDTTMASWDAGTPQARLGLGPGWSWDERIGDTTFVWATERQAIIFVRLSQSHDASIALRVAPLTYPGAPVQFMAILVNGQPVGRLALRDGWQEVSFGTPASVWRAGMNTVTLEFSRLASPARVLGSTDPRTLAVMLDWLRVEQQ